MRRVAKQSAGLLLYRERAGAPEVLLVHPGGPFWEKKDLGASSPEVDRAEWFALGEARRRINPAQAVFLERLRELLGGKEAR